MNTSKRNFLDRFNGKIGFVTKHGELITRSSFDSGLQTRLYGEDFVSIKDPKTYKLQQNAPIVRQQFK